jgi:hypothetical protein
LLTLRLSQTPRSRPCDREYPTPDRQKIASGHIHGLFLLSAVRASAQVLAIRHAAGLFASERRVELPFLQNSGKRTYLQASHFSLPFLGVQNFTCLGVESKSRTLAPEARSVYPALAVPLTLFADLSRVSSSESCLGLSCAGPALPYQKSPWSVGLPTTATSAVSSHGKPPRARASGGVWQSDKRRAPLTDRPSKGDQNLRNRGKDRHTLQR